MNIRDRVHLASQGFLCLNSLTVSRLSHNELKGISTHYRPVLNNGVGPRFVLGCQQPDCCKGRGHAGYLDDSNSLRKCVVGGAHFHQLLTDELPLPAEDGNPRTVEVGVKIEKKRLSVF